MSCQSCAACTTVLRCKVNSNRIDCSQLNDYVVHNSACTISLHDTIEFYLQGADLFDTILHCQRFSEGSTIKVMYQLGLALVYLHAHRIVHRDIVPENIFVSCSVMMSVMQQLQLFHIHAAHLVTTWAVEP